LQSSFLALGSVNRAFYQSDSDLFHRV
jgi:hypothetical protein